MEDTALAAAWQWELREDLTDGVQSSAEESQLACERKRDWGQPWLCRTADLPAARWVVSGRRGRTRSSHPSTAKGGPVLAVSGVPGPALSVSAHAECLSPVPRLKSSFHRHPECCRHSRRYAGFPESDASGALLSSKCFWCLCLRK